MFLSLCYSLYFLSNKTNECGLNMTIINEAFSSSLMRVTFGNNEINHSSVCDKSSYGYLSQSNHRMLSNESKLIPPKDIE